MARRGRSSKHASGAPGHATGPLRLVLAPARPEDVIALMKAWRFWFVAGLIGALLGAAISAIFPPPFRARATVNVDFHLEQAWPQSNDREQFYYLERETRKLIEIAMSDEVLAAVAATVPSTTAGELRSHVVRLSQPGNGGWHFYADHGDAGTARAIAGGWAIAFAEEVQRQVAAATGGLEPYITVDVTQVREIGAEPRLAQGWYILAGAAIGLALAAIAVLFVSPR